MREKRDWAGLKISSEEDLHLTEFLNCLPDSQLSNLKLEILLLSFLHVVVGLVNVVQAVSLTDDLVACTGFVIAELFNGLRLVAKTLVVERVVLWSDI